MENPNVSNLLLPSVPECNNMTLEGVAELYDHMRKETILKQFCDLQKIKYRESINQFYIVIDRKQYTAKTRRELIDKLFEKYCGDAVTTLEQAYLEWMHWRASINTSSKTLKENKNEWKHYTPASVVQLCWTHANKKALCCHRAFGNTIVKVVPKPGELAALIVPLWQINHTDGSRTF